MCDLTRRKIFPLARVGNLGATGFASRLYTKMLGRAFDADGLNAWTQVINAAPTRDTLLNVALNGFMHSPEFISKNLGDEAFVQGLYRTFLDREADKDGKQAWVAALQARFAPADKPEAFEARVAELVG